MKFEDSEAYSGGRYLKARGHDGELVEFETVTDNPELLFIEVDGAAMAALKIKKAVKVARAILKEFGE